MDERNENDKLDEILLPGFRFHPTDEELVGFYLKRKIQQRPLSIELIKQLDIYKYDPWDLPKLATTGEKEWYFYCPRDRKYRNSARPNRVTGAGFWKATGTDRPIYSSEGNKCIGLKKSLVFYKGKAAKGIKTDWMMHEFRLPSLIDSVPPKRFMDKTIPANVKYPQNYQTDSWAICRIFKKTNSTAQRALSQSWVSPLPETASSTDAHVKSSYNTQFSLTSSMAQYFNCNNDVQQQPSSSSSCLTNSSTNSPFSPFDFVPYKPINPVIISKPHHQLPNISSGDLTSSFMFSPFEPTIPAAKCNINDVSSVLLSMSSDSILGDFGKASDQCIGFVGSQDQYSGLSTTALPHYEMQAAATDISNGDHHLHHEDVLMKNQHMMNHVDDQWESTVRPIGFPFSLPMMSLAAETWKPSSLWDCSSCPREISTSVSTSKFML